MRSSVRSRLAPPSISHHFHWLLRSASNLTSYLTSYTLRYMGSWKLQDAKARFSELLNTALKKGPQVVTRRGQDAAVLVPIEEWHRLKRAARPSLKALLLQPEPTFDLIVPPRGRLRRRKQRPL